MLSVKSWKEHIYVIALANGIRIAACGIPKFQNDRTS